MKTFLAMYIGTQSGRAASGWDALAEEERQRLEASGMQAWGEWMQTHGASITVPGGPLGKTKQVSRKGIADVTNNLVGYVVLQAESHQEAAALFRDHPHFSIFPGDSVEIMECLPIPGQ